MDAGINCHAMRGTICTLFEGHHHYGVGALVNSLYLHGYRGTIWAGYRGGELPFWARNAKRGAHGWDYSPAEGLTVCFFEENPPHHYSAQKPAWLRKVLLELEPGAEAAFYFDPDIVVKCRWSFFEEWAAHGIALCEDVTCMPETHPIRLGWEQVLTDWGYTPQQRLRAHFNAGFIGIRRDCMEILDTWESIVSKLKTGLSNHHTMCFGDRDNPFQHPYQDAMNMACMATKLSLSWAGRDAMDFEIRGYIMSHAINEPKPWRMFSFFRALFSRLTPTRAERQYWNYVTAPIRLFPGWLWALKRLDLIAAQIVGRIYSQNSPGNF